MTRTREQEIVAVEILYMAVLGQMDLIKSKFDEGCINVNDLRLCLSIGGFNPMWLNKDDTQGLRIFFRWVSSKIIESSFNKILDVLQKFKERPDSWESVVRSSGLPESRFDEIAAECCVTSLNEIRTLWLSKFGPPPDPISRNGVLAVARIQQKQLEEQVKRSVKPAAQKVPSTARERQMAEQLITAESLLTAAGIPEDQTMLSPGEMARAIGCSDQSVRRLCHAGELGHLKVLRDFRIPRSAALAFLSRGLNGGVQG